MEQERPSDTQNGSASDYAGGWIVGIKQQMAQIRKRRVPRVAVTYSLGLWFFVQTCDVLFPLLGIPEANFSGVLILGILGLPVSMAFAWAFRITPGGVKRERGGNAGSITGIEVFVNVFFIVASITLASLLLLRLPNASA